jgi:hypothetical protein
MQKKIVLLILFSTLVRCTLAFCLEFGNDEVYYWTYALHLQWNYFDHPPMVAVLIRFFTLGGLLHNELFVRAGSIVCAAVNTWLVFITTKKVSDERAGWYAALLYTSSFYCSIVAGTLILPDSPQVLFWMLGIFLMIAVIDKKTVSSQRSGLLLLLGIVIGLCIMSKVHGIFLWIGFGLYILFYDRSLLRRPSLYGAVLLTAIVVSPILIWNIQNNFITYSFHNSRVGFLNKLLDWSSFLRQVIGSVLYSNPINFVLYVIAVAGVIRDKHVIDGAYRRLFLLLAVPLILVLLVMSLFNETLPHWSGPAYISILIITAVYFSRKNKNAAKTPHGILAACLLLLFLSVAGILAIKFSPVAMGSREQRILGDGDVSLDMVGWQNFSMAFDSVYKADKQAGLMQENAFIISDKWFPAASLDYYVAAPLSLQLFAAGKLVNIHHYAWLNTYRPPLVTGADAYFIYPSNYFGPPKMRLQSYFEKMDSAQYIPQYRSGIHVRDFVIVRLHRYKGNMPSNGVISFP